MIKFIAKRLFYSLLTIFVVITLTFFIMKAIPGNAFTAEKGMPPQVYQNILKHYNLDKPIIQQYGIYLGSIARLDFGPSMTSDTFTVNQSVEARLPVSMFLGGQALLLSIFLGLILGALAALNHNKPPDYIAMIFSIIGISVPSFILATLLQDMFAVKLHLFPAAKWEDWSYSVLPTLTLAMMPTAQIARIMRSSMLEVLGQDYIKTARAKGLSKLIVVLKHTIRNAILPVVTMLGTIATNLLTGSFVVEKIFAIPGIGSMFVDSIFTRDYPAIMAAAIIYCTILIALTFIIDVLYPIIDPRIKITGVEASVKT